MSRLGRPVAFAFAGVCAAFAASRLFHLTLLPVFVDESLHIYWPRRLFEEGRFLHHMADGKSLQIWVLHPFMRLASNPPWAARAVSVVLGGLAMTCAFLLGRRLYGPAVGLVAAALYTVSPFALFYDRLALADIFVASFAALTLLASLALVDAPSGRRGLLTGLALSACVLSKMTGFIFVAVPALAVWWLRPRKPGAWRAVGLAYGVATALCAFPVLYFFEGFQVWAHLLGLVATWLGRPVALAGMAHGHTGRGADHLSTIFTNLRDGSGWLWSYWTGPLFLLGLAGIGLALYKRDRSGLLLAVTASAPLAAFALVSAHWFPRYIVCSVVPFAVLAARVFVSAVELAGSRAQQIGLPALLLLAGPAIALDYRLLTEPEHAVLPAIERFQFIEGWPSGYGTAEVARFLLTQAQQQPDGIVVVLDRRTERTVVLILRSYVMNATRLELRTDDLAAPGALDALELEARRQPVYVALAEPFSPDQELPNRDELVSRAQHRLSGFKPTGAKTLALYQLGAGSTR